MGLAHTTNPGAHLRDSFIVAKVGIARMRDRFPSRAVKLDKTDPPEDPQKYKIQPAPRLFQRPNPLYSNTLAIFDPIKQDFSPFPNPKSGLNQPE
jgi:hypothetical protein